MKTNHGFRRRRSPALGMSTALIVLVTLAACGTHDPTSRVNSTSSTDGTAGNGKMDAVVRPPKEYFNALLTDRMQLASSGALNSQKQQILWLNFNGASVTYGFERDQSFLPCKSSITIPSAGFSSGDQTTIAQEVAKFYSNASVSLAITFDKPSSGDFTTIHVGGSYSSLGCSGGGSVAGIAPFDEGNANPNDVGFAFVKTKDVYAMSRIITHEAGHSFGLDHTDNKADLMYPVDSAQATGFGIGKKDDGAEQNGPAILQTNLGSGSATLSGTPVAPSNPAPVIPLPPSNNVPQFPNIPSNIPQLPGLANLGNLSALIGNLPSTLSTALTCVLPSVTNGSAIPSGINLPNASGAIGILTLLQAAVTNQSGAMNMANLISLLTGTPNINQIIALAGISISASQCISQLIPISIPGVTGSIPNQSATPMDIAQILGINQITDPSQLIALITQYSQVIAANGQGTNTSSLLSLVLMAVGQQYLSANFKTP